MAKAWATRLIASDFAVTIDDVPAIRRQAVLALRAKEGLDGYGNKLAEAN